ncbi:hypothetical protein PSTH68_03360 [Pseudomonas syringae pv. theae]|nr:hypothetical protein PSTH68_03360 [Pseudomonas syringae pv. theae]GKQ43673.1 hypothetical protein PSTH2693_00975 [Pseudomonas syringae pv. theae]
MAEDKTQQGLVIGDGSTVGCDISIVAAVHQHYGVFDNAFFAAFQVQCKVFTVFVLNTDHQFSRPFRQLNQQGKQGTLAIVREKILFREALDELVDHSVCALTCPVFTHRNRAGAEPVRSECFLFVGSGKLAHGCCFHHGYFLIATWKAGASIQRSISRGTCKSVIFAESATGNRILQRH